MTPSSEDQAALAEQYAQHAAVQQEVCSRLLERVEHIQTSPLRILCLGAGDGEAPAALKKRFRKAKVTVLDPSPAMLKLAAGKSSFLRPFSGICAGIDRLPFPDRSFDLLFANLAGHWRHDGALLMSEYRRVLTPGGRLLFSSLGIGSFSSLTVDLNGVANDPGLPRFEDIMEAGDQMMAAGFREPVMDTDRISFSYPDFQAMCHELYAAGWALEASNWKGWRQAISSHHDSQLQVAGSTRPVVQVEVIYGAAFAPEDGQPVRHGGAEVATFSVESLRNSARQRKKPR